MACLSDDDDSPHLGSPPWSLNRICRRWRNVAVQAPLLWRRVNLFIHEPEDTATTEADDALFFEHLLRSGSCPLHVHLEFEENSEEFENLSVDALIHSSSRWEKVHLEHVASLFFDTLSSIKGNLPMLKALSLEFSDTGPHWETLDAFSDAPELRSLHLSGDDIGGFLGLLQLPWTQLTQLHLSRVEFQDALAILHSTLSLVTYEMTDCSGSFREATHPVHLQHLETLALTTTTETTPVFDSATLRYITAPLLRNFYLHVHGSAHSFSRSLLTFFDNSNCALELFSISFLPAWSFTMVHGPELLGVLNNLPKLKYLEIQCANAFPDHIFKRIFERENMDISLCPELQSLQFEGPLHPDDLLSRTILEGEYTSQHTTRNAGGQMERYVGLRWEAPLQLGQFTPMLTAEMARSHQPAEKINIFSQMPPEAWAYVDALSF